MAGAGETKDLLLSEVAPHVKDTETKVTVVGVGQVGMACVFSILAQVITLVFYYFCIIECTVSERFS